MSLVCVGNLSRPPGPQPKEDKENVKLSGQGKTPKSVYSPMLPVALLQKAQVPNKQEWFFPWARWFAHVKNDYLQEAPSAQQAK